MSSQTTNNEKVTNNDDERKITNEKIIIMEEKEKTKARNEVKIKKKCAEEYEGKKVNYHVFDACRLFGFVKTLTHRRIVAEAASKSKRKHHQ